jgi:cholesterol oxidase
MLRRRHKKGTRDRIVDYDTIIIGSGFGGSITACRLAEAGYRVLVLERGRRWDKTTYPRTAGDSWWWDPEHPEQRNGWIDLRLFRHIAVAQGAAVGGGISTLPHPEIFARGWPPEITWEVLQPHYRRVAQVMAVQQVPVGQWPPRMKLMQEAAGRIGAADRFSPLELAVSFDPDLDVTKPETLTPAASKRFVNAQGVEQGYCVHLGNCDIGCDVDARNTLDRNYLALAERHGAEVRPLHLVRGIEPIAGGYTVQFDRLDDGQREPGTAAARLVIVAGGSLNSTELLLRCRDVAKSLPDISPFLGRSWSSNGDFLTPAIYTERELTPWFGPTITSRIDFLDRSEAGQSFWVQDGGFPDMLRDALQAEDSSHPGLAGMLDAIRNAVGSLGPLQRVMPWFAQGVDAGDGTLRLRRRWWIFGEQVLDLDWDIAGSEALVDAIVAMHRRLSVATGGTAVVPPSWGLLKYLITPHPLGGCGMGVIREGGVVDHRGAVFGYPGLYVIDGAIIPGALGVNPSRTIGALAERAAGLIVKEGA